MQPFFYLHKPFSKIFCCCRYLVMTKWYFLFATMHSFFTKAIYSKPVFYLFSIKVSQKIILLPSCTISFECLILLRLSAVFYRKKSYL